MQYQMRYILQFNISQRVEYVTDSRIRTTKRIKKRKNPLVAPPVRSPRQASLTLGSASLWAHLATMLFDILWQAYRTCFGLAPQNIWILGHFYGDWLGHVFYKCLFICRYVLLGAFFLLFPVGA